MSRTPHELHDAFPADAGTIHALKLSNAHFAKLADEYHDVNRAIHRVETEVEPASDEALEALKKARLKLADEVAALIAAHRQTA